MPGQNRTESLHLGPLVDPAICKSRFGVPAGPRRVDLDVPASILLAIKVLSKTMDSATLAADRRMAPGPLLPGLILAYPMPQGGGFFKDHHEGMGWVWDV